MHSYGPRETGGSGAAIDRSAVSQLTQSLTGRVMQPGDDGYDAARAIWNAMIDRKPAVIARAANAGDVQSAVRFAQEHSLLFCVRGGGHNVAGNAVCNGGFMLDLSAMNFVRIDPAARRAEVGPGATLADLDREAQKFGLATPTGINSTTGIAGLTLGGGFGWLSRKHGLTADNLVEAEVVTADGNILTANGTENPDLFWAIRGGGGNFGVVIRFLFELHPVGPNVMTGLVVYPLSEAGNALRHFRDYANQLGNDTFLGAVFRKAPPLPFLPPESHGADVLIFAAFHAGNPDHGREAIEPLRRFGGALGDHIGLQPYTAWQSLFDSFGSAGVRNYWKSHFFQQLDDGMIDVAVKYAGSMPSPDTEILIAQLGGAISDVPSDQTAYAHRDARFVLNVHGRWADPNDDTACIDWCRRLFNDLAPYASGGAYVNFMTEDESERVKPVYGSNYDRLRKIKAKYDPDNLFRMNQNIPPRG